jgi:hypothetical protein
MTDNPFTRTYPKKMPDMSVVERRIAKADVLMLQRRRRVKEIALETGESYREIATKLMKGWIQ